MQVICHVAPKSLRVFDRLAVDALVVCQALYVRVPAEVLGAFELALFLKYRVNVAFDRRDRSLLRHGSPQISGRIGQPEILPRRTSIVCGKSKDRADTGYGE